MLDTLSKEERVQLIVKVAKSYVNGLGMTHAKLATKFGVSRGTIYNFLQVELPLIDKKLHLRVMVKSERNRERGMRKGLKIMHKTKRGPAV